MAHFIGYVTGRAKSTASRLGTKSSGIVAQAQGWSIGGRVDCWHSDDGVDVVEFTLTGGSNGATQDKRIAVFRIGPNGIESVGA